MILLFFFKHHVFQELFLVLGEVHGCSVAILLLLARVNSRHHGETGIELFGLVEVLLVQHHFVRVESIVLELITITLLMVHLLILVRVLYRMMRSYCILMLLLKSRCSIHILIFLYSKVWSLILLTNFIYYLYTTAHTSIFHTHWRIYRPLWIALIEHRIIPKHDLTLLIFLNISLFHIAWLLKLRCSKFKFLGQHGCNAKPRFFNLIINF